MKDKLGDITVSDNYRAIASGCLLLKLIDLVVLRLEGEKLGFDEMQFAYQAKSSTTMYTWTVTNVVEYFETKQQYTELPWTCRRPSTWSNGGELFKTLLERKVDCIFLR